MSLQTLPPELIAMIIQSLDMRSVHNLHDAGIPLQGLVKECHFSLNTLATARTLRSNFFLQTSQYLKVLNLRAVHDLDATSLLPALTVISNLTDLDVTYTDVILADLLPIFRATPNIKNIGINYSFGAADMANIKDDLLTEYQNAFAALRNLTLVYNRESEEVFLTKLLTHMLQKADLNSFKLIYTHVPSFLENEQYDCISTNLQMVKLTNYEIFILNGKSINPRHIPLLTFMDFKQYEMIILNDHFLNLFATKTLRKFIVENFYEEVYEIELNVPPFEDVANEGALHEECVLMFWNTARTNFDDNYYLGLWHTLREYLFFYFDDSCQQVADWYKWYRYKLTARDDMPNVELNCDVFERKDVYLSVNISHRRWPFEHTLNVRNVNFLSKLKYLYVKTVMKFHPDFFKNLFEHADSLETLHVYLKQIPESFIYINKCKNLKNIYINMINVNRKDCLAHIFSYLSECPTLENIFLTCPKSMDYEADPSELFRKCDNLYNICIQIRAHYDKVPTEIFYTPLLNLFKKVRSDLQKYALNIDINNKDGENYTPYLTEFNIYQFIPLSNTF